MKVRMAWTIKQTEANWFSKYLSDYAVLQHLTFASVPYDAAHL